MRNKNALAALVLALPLAWTASARGADGTEYEFNIERQSLSRALQEFAKQSGVQIIFFSRVTDGYEAPALNGRYTAAAALGRLLNGSDLTFREVNPKTIEVQPRNARSGQGDSARIGAAEPKLRLTQAPASSWMQNVRLAQVERPAPQDVSAQQDDRAGARSGNAQGDDNASPEVVVTGSRIRGLLGEQTIQPVMIMTAEDIERTGATSLGEVFGYVPQISSFTEGFFEQSPFSFGASSGSSTDTRMTANLRGAPAGGTLLLINGRRAPRNGQEQAGTDGYDLSGIPLASVERIEVLLDGASAIYGADAVGGVINVILKEDYQGTDVKLTYGNAFDTDVHVFDGSLMYGFARGKFSAMATLAVSESGNLMWADRDFLGTQDRRPWGGTNATSAQIPSGNGAITLPAGNALGLPANTIVTIPVGSNGSNMQLSDYANAIGAPPGTDPAIWAAYNSPYSRQSIVSSMKYQLTPRVALFGDLRWSESESVVTASPLAVSSLSIPADAPGNIFGVPVTMRRFLIDLPQHPRTSRVRNSSATIGLRADIMHGWRLEASAGPVFTRPEYSNPLGFSISSQRFQEALNDPDPSKRPNLFYDATTPGLNPNLDLLMELGSPDQSREEGETWIYQISADGPIVDLWAGELRAAVGSEYRAELVDFPLQSPNDQFGARARDRYATGVFAELRLPLISDRQNLKLVDRLEVMVAVRRDMYGRDEFDDATKPRYGIMYRPFSWLMTRASYGEGYKVPSLNQLYAPARTTTIFFSAANPGRDIYRDNEAVALQLPILTGGNPNLKPEETESTTAGIVLDVPLQTLRGLSFSVDYFDHKYLNRISPSLSFVDRLAIFPELFDRADPEPDDPPGWPGKIIGYDNRAVNVSFNRITGWDAGIRYLRRFSWGDLRIAHNASKVYRNVNIPRPGAPPATNAVPQSLPLRMNGSVFVKKGPLETGILMTHRDEFKRSLTERLTPEATRWDWRVSYNFTEAGWRSSGWFGDWLASTRMSLTIFNMFNVDPPMSGPTGIPDSSVVDAVGRRFSLSFTTSFGTNNARR